MKNEIASLKKLDNPNIVKIYECYEDHFGFYIVTELCTGGELFDEIVSRKFSEVEAARLLRTILKCLHVCHLNNIVHRDLKPENIMLESSKDYDQIKLIDFGTSIEVILNEAIEGKIGSPSYVAPEVIYGITYSSKVDLWSCGVIAFILLSGKLPFYGKNTLMTLEHVKTGKFSFSGKIWNHVSDLAKDFISRLLVIDPDKRLSAEQALEHPWINLK